MDDEGDIAAQDERVPANGPGHGAGGDLPPAADVAPPPAGVARRSSLFHPGRYLSLPDVLLRRTDLAASAKLVWMALAGHLGPDGTEVWPSINRLARMTGLDRKTVLRDIAALEDAELLTLSREIGHVNRYRLLQPEAGLFDAASDQSEKATGGKRPTTATSDQSQKGTSPKKGPVGNSHWTSPKKGPEPVPKRDSKYCISTVLSKSLLAGANDAPAKPSKKPARGPPKSLTTWSPQTHWSLDPRDRAVLQAAYPAVNIEAELARMTAWLVANPAKAHKSNWLRFLNNWLRKEQDRGGQRTTAPRLGAAPHHAGTVAPTRPGQFRAPLRVGE